MSLQPQHEHPRIGVDLHVLEGLHQGSRTHCLELFSRVPALLGEVQFVFFADLERLDPATTARLRAGNVSLAHMPHRPSVQRLLLQLPALAARFRLDLLHTQYIAPPHLRCARAVTVHDLLFEDFPEFFPWLFRLRSRLLVRHSARRARLVYTVSEFSKRELLRHYGIDPGKVTVTSNAADAARFGPGDAGREQVESLGLSPGEYLLNVGRLEPRKNHQRLLRAFAALPQPRPRLAVIGQRDFGFEEILRLKEELGLGDEVIFLEKAGDDILPALYRHARLFVYPTLAEGFGMPVIEAMASGVPVVTSNTTALPEVAGDAALLVDPHSTEAIAAAMQRILHDSELSRTLRAAGLRQASSFNWDKEAARLAATYRAHFSAQAAREGTWSSGAVGARGHS